MNEQEWRELAARQLEQFTVTTQKYRAENQRLRKAMERAAEDLEAWELPPRGVIATARRLRTALAGAGE